MIITPVFIRKSMPDKPKVGYGDIVRIYNEDELVFECPSSTCPNPYQPKTKKRWQDVYTMICCGMYTYTTTFRKQWGMCLAVNDGLEVPAIMPNSNHGGKSIATQIFAHPGGIGSYDGLWRGSAGCLTLPPKSVTPFFSFFKDGMKGAIIITDNENFTMNDGETIWVKGTSATR